MHQANANVVIVRSSDRALIGQVLDADGVRDWAMDDGNVAFDELPDFIFESPTSFFLLGYLNGELVGLVHAYQRNGVSVTAHIAVLPAFHKTGVATALSHAAARWLFSYGFFHIALEVAVDNAPAISLARRVGFKDRGSLTKSYQRGERLIDELMFELTKEEYPSWAG